MCEKCEKAWEEYELKNKLLQAECRKKSREIAKPIWKEYLEKKKPLLKECKDKCKSYHEGGRSE